MQIIICNTAYKYQIYALFVWGAIGFFSQHAVAQTRPAATIANGNSGIISCSGCQQLDLDNAWDADPDSRATLDISSSILGGSAYVVYEFANSVNLYNNLILTFGYSGPGFLSGLISSQVFEHLTIQLQDNSGTEITTYDNTNMASVNLVNASENLFEIRIINPSANTRRIRIEAGSLLSLLNKDSYIYDIVQQEAAYDFVTRDVDVGYYEGGSPVSISLCLGGCTITDQDHATINYDPNSEYARIVSPISATLGEKYLYARYDWGGTTTYAGLDYDIYLVVAQENFVSLTTDLFDNDQLEVVLEYSDASQETFSASDNSSLVEANVLYPGSNKFFIRIDANDGKSVRSVEVRLYRPIVSGTRMAAPLAEGDNEMRVYNAFAADSDNNPLPVSLLYFYADAAFDQVQLQWATAWEEHNDHFLIEHSTDASSFHPLIKIPAADQGSSTNYYEAIDDQPAFGQNYYRLTQVDLDGSISQFPVVSAYFQLPAEALIIKPVTEEGRIYVSVAENSLTNREAVVWIRDAQGRTIQQDNAATLGRNYSIILPHNVKPGVYLVSLLTEGSFLTRKILLD
uniref:T9SS type A sorting domain-containing protein n=1 Tax=Roseihalotalea indica TaxID=2867963 RepID=A0AA49GQR4_9BACT|nr:hypothetical protein K4G66_08505 [Tunicatimonas sp. TK19036]